MQITCRNMLLSSLTTAVLISLTPHAQAALTCPTGDVQYNNLEVIGKDDTVITVDHRGGMTDIIPENSKGAFKASYDNCRHGIETDVRITKDGKFVIFHDESIGRLLTNYKPETNKGPNQLVTHMNSTDLIGKNILDNHGSYSSEKVISLREFLQHYIDVKGNSLIYLDVKFKGIDNLSRLLDEIAVVGAIKGQEYIYKRVVVKFSMDLVPTYETWNKLLTDKKFTAPIMANPYISPWAKIAINKLPELPQLPGDSYPDNTSRAVSSWSRQAATLVPNVEVVIKNSDDFIKTTTSESVQGKYIKPTSLHEDNAIPGTMAAMVTIVKKNKKALGLFVPVPDYIEWHPYILTRNVTVRHADDNKQIDIEEAFYTSKGQCCTTMKDKISSDESGDVRLHLAWGRSIGVNVITVDDPSSADKFHRDNGDLDKTSIPEIVPTDANMNSILARQLGYYPNPENEIIDMQVWKEDSAFGWGSGPVCIWDNPTDSQHYAWIWSCEKGKTSSDYTRGVVLQLVKDHETLPYVGVATQIYTHDKKYCLSVQSSSLNLMDWVTDCDYKKSYNTLFIKDDSRLYPIIYDDIYNGEVSSYITSKLAGSYWGISYGGLEVYPISDYYLDDAWGQWKFVIQE